MNSSIFTTSQGYQIYSWKMGDDQKPPVLIIHGILEHSLRYLELAKFLNDSGFQVIGFDLPGHGQSSGPSGHVKSFQDFAKVTHEVANHFNCKTHHVFGHSMGGLAAYQYLQINSKNIQNIILHNPAFYIGGPIEKFIIKILGPSFPYLKKIPFYLPLPCPIAPKKLVGNLQIQKSIKSDSKIIRFVSPATLFGLVQASIDAHSNSLFQHKGLKIIQTTQDPVIDGKANIEYFRKHTDKLNILSWGLHEPHNDTNHLEDWNLILKLLI